MNKLKLILSAAAVSMMIFTSNSSIYALEYCDTITYVKSENEVIITGYKGNPEVIDLPCQIDGLPVTEIRENAFYKCDTLKKVVISESVERIGHHAFYDCTALEYAEISGNTKHIPDGLFYGCENLECITLNISPSTIGNYAFYGCRSLSEFDIPLSVTDIGAYSFADCCSLSRVTFNTRLQNIDAYSFYNCLSLEKVNLPDDLLSIGKYAVGFSDNGISDNVTITGMPDSAAEHYSDNYGIKFRNRIRYKNYSRINADSVSGFFTWLSFAIVYFLIMAILISKRKKLNKKYPTATSYDKKIVSDIVK